MKKTILLTLTLLLPALSPAQDLRHPWTLQECLDWALENSLTVKQGELNLAQQEIQTNTAKNSWLPTVSASANESVTRGGHQGPGAHPGRHPRRRRKGLCASALRL